MVKFYEDTDKSLIRVRERVYGNTVYTIIAREKRNAKETAFDITKRLIEHSADSIIGTELINDSLKGCNSGGKK